MLKVDLVRLNRDGRVTVAVDVPVDAVFWTRMDVEPAGPLEVRLVAEPVGMDVAVHGDIRGELEAECRRCLEALVIDLEEEVDWLFRPPADDGGYADEEVRPLPADELDLEAPLREHVMLRRPRYVVCRESCAGLCQHCGANLNETTCDCATEELDERWGPLLELRQED